SGENEDQRQTDGPEEEEHAYAQAAPNLDCAVRPVGDSGEQNVDDYFFFSAAAGRSLATSWQLLITSLPWTSSTSASTGLPLVFIRTTPIHCGGIACWSQPRMMTLPHGNSISNPSLKAVITLSVSALFPRLMASAMM